MPCSSSDRDWGRSPPPSTATRLSGCPRRGVRPVPGRALRDRGLFISRWPPQLRLDPGEQVSGVKGRPPVRGRGPRRTAGVPRWASGTGSRMGTGRWRPWAVHQTCGGSRFSRLLFVKSGAGGARARVAPHRPRAGPKRPAGHLLPRPHVCREPHRTVVSGEPRPRGTGLVPSGDARRPLGLAQAQSSDLRYEDQDHGARPATLSVWVQMSSPHSLEWLRRGPIASASPPRQPSPPFLRSQAELHGHTFKNAVDLVANIFVQESVELAPPIV